jgi:hypothetical protein
VRTLACTQGTRLVWARRLWREDAAQRRREGADDDVLQASTCRSIRARRLKDHSSDPLRHCVLEAGLGLAGPLATCLR